MAAGAVVDGVAACFIIVDPVDVYSSLFFCNWEPGLPLEGWDVR